MATIKIVTLAVILLWMHGMLIAQPQTAARRSSFELYDTLTSKSKISGILVGKDPKKNDSYYYFKHVHPLIVYVSLRLGNNAVLNIDTADVTGLNPGLPLTQIEIHFTSSEAKHFRRLKEPLFDFTFYKPGTPKDPDHIVASGQFSIPNYAIHIRAKGPFNELVFRPGFVVSAPEELSIDLIKDEIDDYLESPGPEIQKYATGSSNYTRKPHITIDSVSRLGWNIRQNYGPAQLDTLAEVMNIYRYCNSFLDSTSFFKYEGWHLKQDIDSLQQVLAAPASKGGAPLSADSIQIINQAILRKKASLIQFQSALARLEFVTDKISYLIKEAFLEYTQ